MHSLFCDWGGVRATPASTFCERCSIGICALVRLEALLISDT